MKHKRLIVMTAVTVWVTMAVLIVIAMSLLIVIMVQNEKSKDCNTAWVASRYAAVTVRRDLYLGPPGAVYYDILIDIDSKEEFRTKADEMYAYIREFVSCPDENAPEDEIYKVGFYYDDYYIIYNGIVDNYRIRTNIE